MKSRAVMESSIYGCPPCTREVWDWLLMNACFKPYKFKGYTLKEGQQVTTMKTIQECLSWSVGFRKEVYSDRQMKNALKTLTSEGMIRITKVKHGSLISICNYKHVEPKPHPEGVNAALKAEVVGNAPSVLACTEYKNKKEKKNKKERNQEKTPPTPSRQEASTRKPLPYSIWSYLDDEAEHEAKLNAEGWDISMLSREFDESVKAGIIEPPRYPKKAFPAWCAKYTKGNPPR